MSTQASAAKSKVQVETVTIRFVGDSGDGMQLTGTEFTKANALAGNDIATFPDYPAEIRAPAGSLAGVSGLPGELRRRSEIHTPGRRAGRARRDEPGRAQDEPRRPQDRRHAHRERRRLHRVEPREGRLQVEPARGRRAEAELQDLPRRHEQAHRDRARGLGPVEQGGGALQELLRARPHVLALQPRPSSRSSSRSGRSSRRSRRSPRRTRRSSRPATPSARPPRSSSSATRSRPRSSRRAPTATSPATTPPRSASPPSRSTTGRQVFLGSYPITPATEILQEMSYFKEHGVVTFQAEDEIAGIGSAIGASFGGVARRHHHLRPGPRAQDRDDRPRRHRRAPARHRERAARRPVHRHADEDRAVGPPHGALRPPRRGAAAGPRGAEPGRLLLRRRWRR